MILPRVHAITDGAVLARPDFLELVRRISALGARVAIHLRDRSAPGRSLADRAVVLRDALAGTGTAFIVNARPDIAAGVAADGVQLGGGDLAVPDARRVLPFGWIGCSVHSVEEAHGAAHAGADYLIAGTTWASESHAAPAPQGPGFIGRAVSAAAPVIAIGGVTPGRAREVHEAGAYGVAAIRSIWAAEDPVRVIEQMLEPWGAR